MVQNLKDFNSPQIDSMNSNSFPEFFMSRDKLILKTRTKIQEQLRLKSTAPPPPPDIKTPRKAVAMIIMAVVSTGTDRWASGTERWARNKPMRRESEHVKEVGQQITGVQRVISVDRRTTDGHLRGKNERVPPPHKHTQKSVPDGLWT